MSARPEAWMRAAASETSDVVSLCAGEPSGGAEHGDPVEHVHHLERRHLRAPGRTEETGRLAHPASLPDGPTSRTTGKHGVHPGWLASGP